MQIFNEINSRKLGEFEYNVFAGFFNNILFIVIIIATIIVQVCMVQYGGQPVRCYPLTWQEHLICAAIGLFSFIQGKLSNLLTPSFSCLDQGVPAHQVVLQIPNEGGSYD
jgi:hypothetical protein